MHFASVVPHAHSPRSRTAGACCNRFGLQRTAIKTHREVRPEPTNCPGNRLQKWIDGYRRSTDVVSLARQ